MQEEIKIKQNQRKQFGLVLLAIIMVAVSAFVFFAATFMGETNILFKIIGVIGILFFGWCLVIILKRFFKPKDILVINDKGIEDNSTAGSLGLIPWSEIKSIYKKKLFTEEFLCIDVLNYEEKIKGSPYIKKLLINGNIRIGFPPVSITLQSTKYKVDEVLKMINEYREIYKL